MNIYIINIFIYKDKIINKKNTYSRNYELLFN